jgi:DivIVA domain-containing protein
MTTTDHRASAHYQSPEAIRDQAFYRRMRGLDADQVYEYLDLLADQVRATERELGEVRTENEQLMEELQRAQADASRLRAELDEQEQVGERVNDQVVQLFSQAQLVAEQMVEDVSRDARERIGHARAHERKIVEEAMSTAGEQVRSYARNAQAQMESVMASFANDVDRLGDARLSEEEQAARAARDDDPLFGRLDTWQVQTRNGTGNGRANGNGHRPGSAY